MLNGNERLPISVAGFMQQKRRKLKWRSTGLLSLKGRKREHYQLIITKLSSYTFSVKRKLPSFPSMILLRHRRTSGDAKLTSSNNTHQPFRTASTRAPYTHTHTHTKYHIIWLLWLPQQMQKQN